MFDSFNLTESAINKGFTTTRCKKIEHVGTKKYKNDWSF